MRGSLIKNTLLGANAEKKLGNPQFYGQWTDEDSQSWLPAEVLEGKKVISLDSRFVDLKNTGLLYTLIKLMT